MNHGDLIIEQHPSITSMSEEELRDFIERNAWTYARTMPKWPHEYVVRKNVRDDRVFLRFVMTIRRYGHDEFFYTKKRRYLDVGSWKYWTMGDWLPTTIIINRAKIQHAPRPFTPNPEPFRSIVNLIEPSNPLPADLLSEADLPHP